jgi:TPR repeat protein
MTSTHRICYIAAAAAELLANAGKKAYPIIIRAEHKKMQPEIQGAEERRQRPRVSEGLGPVDAAPELEAERLLSAVLADIALLSAQSHVVAVAPELEAERLLFAREYAAATVPLQRAIQLGHLPSRALLAWLFLFGREGIAQDRNRAIELVQEGARLGCHHCQGVLAYCLWDCHVTRLPDDDGCIHVQDPPPSCADMALASSTRGSAYGHFVLGILQEEEEEFEEVRLDHFRRAAEQHLDAAQYELGKHVYEGGYCEPSQYAESLRWFQLAAAQGHSNALFIVGLMHELGHGVPADNTEAIRWYRRAAEAGHRQAGRCVHKLQK